MRSKQSSANPPDPMIDEIRQIRRSISKKFGNNVRKQCEYLRSIQDTFPNPVVRLRRRRTKLK